MTRSIPQEASEKKRKQSMYKKVSGFFLDRKQRCAVVMRINIRSHKMNIKKLYKITKITPLSNPVANKMGIARIFRLF